MLKTIMTPKGMKQNRHLDSRSCSTAQKASYPVKTRSNRPGD